MKNKILQSTGALALAALFLAIPSESQAQRGRSSSSSTQVQRAQAQVVAVADERSNSLIVIASTNAHAEIQGLLNTVDANVDDITEIRVFPLKHADPVELSEILNQLFSDSTQQSSNERGSGFSRSFLFGGRSRGGDSDQALRSDQKVVAVPDPRSTSLIVSAPRQMMTQIVQMIDQLDSDTGRKQKVFVYEVEHADVNNMSDILRSMFEGQNSRRSTTTTTTQDNALRDRSGGFGQAGSTAGSLGRGSGGGTGGGNIRR